jgi:hypothetical protein
VFNLRHRSFLEEADFEPLELRYHRELAPVLEPANSVRTEAKLARHAGVYR